MRLPYADVSQYVLASEAIPEIARCYFCGDTNKAESDARIAAQDGALPVFRGTPFLPINRDRWHHDHIHWSSIIDPLYFSRADLLKIYPDLWRSLQSPDNETTLIAVPEGAPDSDTAQSDAIDVDTSGSDQTDAEIDVTQGDTREEKPDALDGAGDGIDRSRIRPTEFTSEEQSKGGSKTKIHFGLLKYLEHLCESGLAADFQKRSDITLGEIEQILTTFAKGGPVEDLVGTIIDDFEHARYDEIAKTLYWEDWMQEQNDKPRKRQQALKSLQPYLDIINRKKPRPEKQDTDLT